MAVCLCLLYQFFSDEVTADLVSCGILPALAALITTVPSCRCKVADLVATLAREGREDSTSFKYCGVLMPVFFFSANLYLWFTTAMQLSGN